MWYAQSDAVGGILDPRAQARLKRCRLIEPRLEHLDALGRDDHSLLVGQVHHVDAGQQPCLRGVISHRLPE
jgi:hypothetical protein